MCDARLRQNFGVDPGQQRPSGPPPATGATDALTTGRTQEEDSAMKSAHIGGSIVRAVLGIVAAAVLSTTWGCAHVAPYERGTLAHPTMSADDPFTTPLANHVQDVSEGATGGLSGGGGGCGCN
jgi:hypothetical protein